MGKFQLVSPYQPKGDQPQAIEALAQGFNDDLSAQTLLGVTGSGKTFTMAAIIEKLQRPTLVIAHNKTLAAQLCAEFRAFFPDSAVEYFVSYYDYYQPEAYIASSDTYIEKDSAINDEMRWTDSNMKGKKVGGLRYSYVQYDARKKIDWFVDAFCRPGAGATLYRLREDIIRR